MKRIAITIDDEVAELLNRYCGKYRIKSAVICMAIKYFFKGGDNDLADEEIQQMLKKYTSKEVIQE